MTAAAEVQSVADPCSSALVGGLPPEVLAGVARIIDGAPPLTEGQRAALKALLPAGDPA